METLEGLICDGTVQQVTRPIELLVHQPQLAAMLSTIGGQESSCAMLFGAWLTMHALQREAEQKQLEDMMSDVQCTKAGS
jgi:hypothetical protein